MSDTWAADVATETRTEQGLPIVADDPAALDRLATLLASAAPRPASSSAGRGTGAAGASSGKWGPSARSSKQEAVDADTSTASQTAAGS